MEFHIGDTVYTLDIDEFFTFLVENKQNVKVTNLLRVALGDKMTHNMPKDECVFDFKTFTHDEVKNAVIAYLKTVVETVESDLHHWVCLFSHKVKQESNESKATEIVPKKPGFGVFIIFKGIQDPQVLIFEFDDIIEGDEQMKALSVVYASESMTCRWYTTENIGPAKLTVDDFTRPKKKNKT